MKPTRIRATKLQIPNVRRKNTKANSDIFPKREKRYWTSKEDKERDMRSEQARGLGYEVQKEVKTKLGT
jgi:hypothetical protein